MARAGGSHCTHSAWVGQTKNTCVREMIMQSVGRSYYFKAYQEFMAPSLSKYRCPKVGYPVGPKWTQSGFKVCVQVVSWPALARHRTGRPRRQGGGTRGAERLGARPQLRPATAAHT
eukprot:COSAG01_NODE_607_length_14866_cov_60.568633_10_plen_117_part_00